jgi:glycosyltransferase involved in cell wall biosynthesis
MASLSIIVPVFNEAQTILLVLQNVRKYMPKSSVIVVNDGSTDETSTILHNNILLYDTLLSLPNNHGKGYAIKKGLSYVNSDYVLIQDADLEYEPSILPSMWQTVLDNDLDLMMTSRLTGSELTRVYYFWHRLGNKIITFVFNIVNNTTFSDIYSGYLIFRKSTLDSKKLLFNGWGQQAEILTIINNTSSKLFEMPIPYYGRTYSEGKKIRALSVLNVLIAIFFTKIRFIKKC